MLLLANYVVVAEIGHSKLSILEVEKIVVISKANALREIVKIAMLDTLAS